MVCADNMLVITSSVQRRRALRIRVALCIPLSILGRSRLVFLAVHAPLVCMELGSYIVAWLTYSVDSG